MTILFISKRNNHGKYFSKLIKHCNIDGQIHFMGSPSVSSLLYLSNVAIDVRLTVDRQLVRKQQAFPKLFNISLVSEIYRESLSIIERCRAAKYIALLTKLKPNYIAVWNGDKSPYHLLVLIAKHLDINVIYFENGLLPNTTTIDYKGVNASNSLPRNAAFYQHFLNQCNIAFSPVSLVQRPLHKKRQQQTTIKLPEKYLFVPLQVPNDSQIVVNSSWIKSMEDFIEQVINAWRNSYISEYTLVFKSHPSWPHDFSHLIAPGQKIKFANSNPTDELIRSAKAVITINSTVGIEALMYNKPVITLGDACYNIEKLVLHAHNPLSLIGSLNLLQHWQPDPKVLQGFLCYLQKDYCIPERWSLAQQTHFLAAEKRLNKQDSFSSNLHLEEKSRGNSSSSKIHISVNI